MSQGGSVDRPIFAGVIPAVVTAFDVDEELDLPCQQRFCDGLIGRGVDGLFVAGSQGESYALTHREYAALVAGCVEAAGGRVPVLAGASAHSTRESVALARHAERAGAAGVVSLPPSFARPSDDELAMHFSAIAAAVDIPLLVYNHPMRTGVPLALPLIERLALRGEVHGVKDSSGDVANLRSLVDRLPKECAVFVGHDACVAEGLRAGVVGTISSSANVLPDHLIAIFEAAGAAQWDTAVSIQEQVAIFRDCFSLGTFPSVVKEALSLLGHSVGPARRPVGPLSEGARAELARVLQVLNLVKGPK